ncbi:hypothetical protein E2C01_097431 [Portunus trituberculatus]
MWTW